MPGDASCQDQGFKSPAGHPSLIAIDMLILKHGTELLLLLILSCICTQAWIKSTPPISSYAPQIHI